MAIDKGRLARRVLNRNGDSFRDSADNEFKCAVNRYEGVETNELGNVTTQDTFLVMERNAVTLALNRTSRLTRTLDNQVFVAVREPFDGEDGTLTLQVRKA